MNQPTLNRDREWRSPDKVVADALRWWADRVERLMVGNVRARKGLKTHQPKAVWNDAIRMRFVGYLADHAPEVDADELANRFDRTIDAARDNPDRFRKAFEREFRPMLG